MIENEIRMLLDSPITGRGAPSLAELEQALTSGYASSMALEAERLRLQRLIAELAAKLGGDDRELRAQLRGLARKLETADHDLGKLRTLLGCLRQRADAARPAA